MRKDVESMLAECPVCQVTKVEHVHIPGLLDPLEIPDMAWSHISMDFIEALPKSKGKEVILVVVDRLTKYAHFLPLSHPYTVQDVIQVFMDHIYKLHGMPMTIVSVRDIIFTSRFYQEMFKALQVSLRFSTVYHPQSDGQTERVNQCLESYLRSMTFQEPRCWMNWLPHAEWWYNTSYHTSLKMTPFQALYGYPPPQFGRVTLPKDVLPITQLTLEEREKMSQELKQNLLKAQNRMKQFADRKRSERQFDNGDMVYLKMQPYRQNAFGLRGSLKLRSKYYGPFRIMKRIGKVAYQLNLPEEAAIHPVFHASQLKKHLGPLAIPSPGLPLVGPDGKIKTEPVKILERQIVQRKGDVVAQWLVQWQSLAPEEATWEDVSFIRKVFPNFQTRGQV